MKTLKLFSIVAVLSLGLAACQEPSKDLPRGEASAELNAAFEQYAATEEPRGLHSIMIVQNGKVIKERWFGEENGPDIPHVLNSCSKTFTSTAVGIAIDEGYFGLDDRLIDFFPDELPDSISQNLAKVTVRNLLTMNSGHKREPRRGQDNWVSAYLNSPIEAIPGTYYCYSSLGTYMLSAIVQKTTGQKVVDFLQPRLFEPLGIDYPKWDESPEGINTGGWGLYVKTEDLAKLGLLLLQKGKWNGKQIVSEEWVNQASAKQVNCYPSGMSPESLAESNLTIDNSDWVQGYGFQIWRCRHNAFRADGAWGQYIIVIPEKNAVIATTAHYQDMQHELNQIWDILYPCL